MSLKLICSSIKSGFLIPSRNYAFKSSLPIKWVRPEKVPCIHPKKSGDLASLPEIDVKNTFPIEFKDSEELKTADPVVKKLFSLEFQPYEKTVKVLRQTLVDAVKRNEMDFTSEEARVARMTADIRDMQLYCEKFPTNKRTKVRLKETIDKRKRLLKNIRKADYKRFEWLLEKLNLFFKPQPPYEVYLRVERKRSMRMLTDEYCKNLIDKRMEDHKAELFAQQKQFLERKILLLETLLKTQQEYQVEKPTVSESDVAKAKEQLKTWIEKHERREELKASSS